MSFANGLHCVEHLFPSLSFHQKVQPQSSVLKPKCFLYHSLAVFPFSDLKNKPIKNWDSFAIVNYFKREGDNLHYDLYVSISEAVLGTSKEIDAVGGKVRIKLEPGIQSGKILRLRGKGVSSLNGYGSGDLLVHVNVWTPKELNKEQKEFFQRMQGNENFEPKPEKSDKSFFEKVKDMFS